MALSLALILAVGLIGPAVSLGPHRVAAQTVDTARVVHSSDGVNVRAEPDYGAEVIATLADGTAVGLRIAETDTVFDPDGITQWWPVVANDQAGWVAGFFLDVYGDTDAAAPPTDAGSDPADTGVAAVPASNEMVAGPELAGALAVVSSPEGVNLRAGASTGSTAIATLKAGEVVELRIAEADTVWAESTRWWPVRAAGQDGWIAGSFLAAADGDAAVPETTVADPGFAPGQYVASRTESSGGVNIRADAAFDAERVGFIPEGDVVQVMDGPFWDPTGSAWYLVTDGEVSGYTDGSLFTIADQPAAPADEALPDDEPDIAVPDEAPRVPQAGLATGSFVSPVASATFTQAYGCSIYWFEPWEAAYGCNFHNGIDLANASYTPLMAADGGVVEYAGWCDCGLGFYVKIDHGNGFQTIYGHMAEQPWVSAGDAVSQGEVIGPMGSTGNSTGPHVHFIVELNGSTVDPTGYL